MATEGVDPRGPVDPVGGGPGGTWWGPGTGWWLASDGRWYPPHLTPGWPAGAGWYTPLPGTQRGARPGRLSGPMWALAALTAVLAVVAVLIPAVPDGGPTGVAGGPIVAFPSFAMPTYPAGCGASQPQAGVVEQVPMTVRHGRLGVIAVVPVCIEGRGPFPFLLDTGASRSLIDTEVADLLHLPAQGSQPLFGVGTCSTSGSLRRVDQWSLGGVPLSGQDVVSAAVPHFGVTRAPAGLIGSDILSRFGAVRLDYDHQLLLLPGPEGAVLPDQFPFGGSRGTGPAATAVAPLPSALGHGSSEPALPLSVVAEGGSVQAQVAVTIGGTREMFIVDSGAAISSVSTEVPGLAAAGLRVQMTSVACTQDVELVHSGSWSVGQRDLLPQLMPQVELEFGGVAGLLGSDVYDRAGWVAIDYRGGRMLLGT